MDKLDAKILTIVQNNARIPISEIARITKKAPTVILERFRKLERNDIIQGYYTRINNKSLNLKFLAFVFVKTNLKGSDEIGAELINIEGVQEVHEIVGEHTYLVKIRTKGPKELSELLSREFGRIEGINNTFTTIALRSLKEDISLPIKEGDYK